MDSISLNLTGGVLRAVVPLGLTVAVLFGLVDQATADQLGPVTVKAVEVAFGAGGLATVIMAGWSIWTNRRKTIAAQAGTIKGAAVVVSEAAPEDVKELALDPDVKGVVPISAIKANPRGNATKVPVGLMSAMNNR